MGLLDRWKASFLPPPNRCSAPLSSNRPGRNERLSLKYLSSPFILYGIGIVASLLAFVLECLFAWMKEYRTGAKIRSIRGHRSANRLNNGGTAAVILWYFDVIVCCNLWIGKEKSYYIIQKRKKNVPKFPKISTIWLSYLSMFNHELLSFTFDIFSNIYWLILPIYSFPDPIAIIGTILLLRIVWSSGCHPFFGSTRRHKYWT